MGDGGATKRATNKFNIGVLIVRDDNYTHLCKEVQTQFVVHVTEDALLYEHDVRATLLDLLAHVEDVLPLVAEYAIHGRVVGNDDTVFHVGLGLREEESRCTGVWDIDKTATCVFSGLWEQVEVGKVMNGNLPSHSFPHPPEIGSLLNKQRDTPILPAINLNQGDGEMMTPHPQTPPFPLKEGATTWYY